MTEFDNAKLRRLDLTALLVFEAVLRTRKAADVAREIGVTPSSVSHALARLRDVFGDPLFIRRPHGLDPTFVARALEPQITAALDALRSAIAAPNAFDSRTSRHVVRMSGGDYETRENSALSFVYAGAPQFLRQEFRPLSPKRE